MGGGSSKWHLGTLPRELLAGLANAGTGEENDLHEAVDEREGEKSDQHDLKNCTQGAEDRVEELQLSLNGRICGGHRGGSLCGSRQGQNAGDHGHATEADKRLQTREDDGGLPCPFPQPDEPDGGEDL